MLATVLDRKTGACSNGSAPGLGSLFDHWNVDIASSTDYYPGGMMMPGRNTEYRWSRMGYNGQVKDDEVYGKGNMNTAMFWQYDTRLGRRWNVDPITEPSQSVYAVFDGNPIWRNDILGNSPNTYETTAGRSSYKKLDDKGGDEVDHMVVHVPETKMPWDTTPEKTMQYDVPVQTIVHGSGINAQEIARRPGVKEMTSISDGPIKTDCPECWLLPLPKGINLFAKGAGITGRVSKASLGMRVLGKEASTSLNYYTQAAVNAGYSSALNGSKVEAGIFVQGVNNVGRLFTGRPMVTIVSSSEATVMGRAWQNQAIGIGLLNIGISAGAGIYNFSSTNNSPSNIGQLGNYTLPTIDNLKIGTDGQGGR